MPPYPQVGAGYPEGVSGSSLTKRTHDASKAKHNARTQGSRAADRRTVFGSGERSSPAAYVHLSTRECGFFGPFPGRPPSPPWFTASTLAIPRCRRGEGPRDPRARARRGASSTLTTAARGGVPMKGRPPKPAEQKRREGNPGKRAQKAPVVIGGREAPDMPKGLDTSAKKVWRQLVEDMTEGGVLDRADWPAVEGAAVVLGLARDLRRDRIGAERDKAAALKDARAAVDPEEQLRAWGLAERHEGRHLKLYRAERDAWAEARQWIDRLGIGPVGRARLGTAAGGKRPGKGPTAEFNDRVGESPRARRAAMRALPGGTP